MVAYNAHVGDVHWRQLSMLRQFEIVFVYLGGYLDEQIPDTLDLVQNMVFGRASLREMLLVVGDLDRTKKKNVRIKYFSGGLLWVKNK